MIKDSHVAGDTFDETVIIPDYPATDAWTLKYRFIPRFTTPTQTPITLTATTSGADYLLQAAPGTTATWVPGVYAWRRWVEKAGARQTLDKNGNGGDWSGEFTVEQDPSTAVQGFDGRSQAQKGYDDAMGAFATFKASGGQVKEYTIGTRQMKFKDSADIVKEIEFWRAQLNAENDTAAMAKGFPNPRNVGMRFNRI